MKFGVREIYTIVAKRIRLSADYFCLLSFRRRFFRSPRFNGCGEADLGEAGGSPLEPL